MIKFISPKLIREKASCIDETIKDGLLNSSIEFVQKTTIFDFLGEGLYDLFLIKFEEQTFTEEQTKLIEDFQYLSVFFTVIDILYNSLKIGNTGASTEDTETRTTADKDSIVKTINWYNNRIEPLQRRLLIKFDLDDEFKEAMELPEQLDTPNTINASGGMYFPE